MRRLRSDAIDLAGQRFTRLVVLRATGERLRRSTAWACRCDCGQDFLTNTHDLRSANTKSCGCLKRDVVRSKAVTHGATRGSTQTPEYRAWFHMKERCSKPTHPEWKNYGALGVSVCARWLDSFEHFLADMGMRPEKHSLDRINVFGNYEPSNCRWADAKTQTQNRRKNYGRQPAAG